VKLFKTDDDDDDNKQRRVSPGNQVMCRHECGRTRVHLVIRMGYLPAARPLHWWSGRSDDLDL